jgi:oligoendopeptidase F
MGDVRTLAHELGHAFHGWVLREMRPWARIYPMTLAETASTFAEQLVTDAALDAARADGSAGARGRLIDILDVQLRDAETFLLNIPMRYDFERAVYTERAAGELSVSRLCELVVEAQRQNYGDAVDPEQLDPWFWASKLHFYIAGVSFYNFPYTFGYLFSTGIAARARAEGPSFLPVYEDLLRRTGTESAEDAARSALGVDLGKPEFWSASIDLLAAALDEFERATAS